MNGEHLKKASQTGKSQEEKVLTFKSKLDDLFDIAAADVLSQLTNEEGIQFLTHQRMKGRPGHMGGVDIKTTQAEDKQGKKEMSKDYIKQQ